MILERSKEESIIYKLITEQDEYNKILGEIGIYIPKFMDQLWKSPKSISKILINADKNDVKKNLSNFIVHNLYDNSSSLNNREEQLIYIVALLLKQEINSLENINSIFITDKSYGIVLN